MIKHYDIKAFITLSNQNRLFGQISSVVKEGIVLYKFTFANSDDFICIKKAADQWTFVSGMHNPNESWIDEIGKQIDRYENDHLSRQA